mmetsp:Transcript_40561/g.115617  ORF Transcript_40561/g.115617 Transcript_40561/m.115617 type:complete len:235 (+) Transcript_40561:593-1297(+)
MVLASVVVWVPLVVVKVLILLFLFVCLVVLVGLHLVARLVLTLSLPLALLLFVPLVKHALFPELLALLLEDLAQLAVNLAYRIVPPQLRPQLAERVTHHVLHPHRQRGLDEAVSLEEDQEAVHLVSGGTSLEVGPARVQHNAHQLQTEIVARRVLRRTGVPKRVLIPPCEFWVSFIVLRFGYAGQRGLEPGEAGVQQLVGGDELPDVVGGGAAETDQVVERVEDHRRVRQPVVV